MKKVRGCEGEGENIKFPREVRDGVKQHFLGGEVGEAPKCEEEGKKKKKERSSKVVMARQSVCHELHNRI